MFLPSSWQFVKSRSEEINTHFRRFDQRFVETLVLRWRILNLCWVFYDLNEATWNERESCQLIALSRLVLQHCYTVFTAKVAWINIFDNFHNLSTILSLHYSFTFWHQKTLTTPFLLDNGGNAVGKQSENFVLHSFFHFSHTQLLFKQSQEVFLRATDLSIFTTKNANVFVNFADVCCCFLRFNVFIYLCRIN